MKRKHKWVIKQDNNDIVITIPSALKNQSRWLTQWGRVLATWLEKFSFEICKQSPYYYIRLNTFGNEKYLQEIKEKSLGICRKNKVKLGEPRKLDFFSCVFSMDFFISIFSNADVEIPGAIFLIAEQNLPFEQIEEYFVKLEADLDDYVDWIITNKSVSGLCYTIDNQLIIPLRFTSLSSINSALYKTAARFDFHVDWQV